jgi:4-oxalocrotonate tautomerase
VGKKEEYKMPVITIEASKMNKEQKASLVKELVAISSDILRIPAEAFVTIIKENEMDNIGNGTQLLSDKQKRY